MEWDLICKSVERAISEYRGRGEPVPEVIKRAYEWVEPKARCANEGTVVDREDLTSLFLHMAGWYR